MAEEEKNNKDAAEGDGKQGDAAQEGGDVDTTGENDGEDDDIEIEEERTEIPQIDNTALNKLAKSLEALVKGVQGDSGEGGESNNVQERLASLETDVSNMLGEESNILKNASEEFNNISGNVADAESGEKNLNEKLEKIKKVDESVNALFGKAQEYLNEGLQAFTGAWSEAAAGQIVKTAQSHFKTIKSFWDIFGLYREARSQLREAKKIKAEADSISGASDIEEQLNNILSQLDSVSGVPGDDINKALKDITGDNPSSEIADAVNGFADNMQNISKSSAELKKQAGQLAGQINDTLGKLEEMPNRVTGVRSDINTFFSDINNKVDRLKGMVMTVLGFEEESRPAVPTAGAEQAAKAAVETAASVVGAIFFGALAASLLTLAIGLVATGLAVIVAFAKKLGIGLGKILRKLLNYLKQQLANISKKLSLQGSAATIKASASFIVQIITALWPIIGIALIVIVVVSAITIIFGTVVMIEADLSAGATGSSSYSIVAGGGLSEDATIKAVKKEVEHAGIAGGTSEQLMEGETAGLDGGLSPENAVAATVKGMSAGRQSAKEQDDLIDKGVDTMQALGRSVSRQAVVEALERMEVRDVERANASKTSLLHQAFGGQLLRGAGGGTGATGGVSAGGGGVRAGGGEVVVPKEVVVKYDAPFAGVATVAVGYKNQFAQRGKHVADITLAYAKDKREILGGSLLTGNAAIFDFNVRRRINSFVIKDYVPEGFEKTDFTVLSLKKSSIVKTIEPKEWKLIFAIQSLAGLSADEVTAMKLDIQESALGDKFFLLEDATGEQTQADQYQLQFRFSDDTDGVPWNSLSSQPYHEPISFSVKSGYKYAGNLLSVDDMVSFLLFYAEKEGKTAHGFFRVVVQNETLKKPRISNEIEVWVKPNAPIVI